MRMVESAKNMEPNIVKKPTAMQLSKARIEAESAFNELQNGIGKVKDTDNLTITTHLEHQETADLVTIAENLMENFIFCAVEFFS